MPITQLSASLRGILAEITARDGTNADLLGRLRRGALNELTRWRDDNGNVAVHFESDVTTYYNPDTPRQWRYSEMRTTVAADGDVTQQAFLDVPMGRPKPSCLINVNGVVPEAFEDLKPGVNCAIYQLHKHLNIPYEEIRSVMENISQALYGDETVTPPCSH